MTEIPNYEYYNSILKSKEKPLVYIDLNLLKKNIDVILQRNSHNKNIRLATKSLRCCSVIQYVLNQNSLFKGLMAYDVREAEMLLNKGFDDILIAYPEVDASKIERIIPFIKNGKKIWFMVDSKPHVNVLQKIAKAHQTKISVCIDVDLSSAFPMVYFGVYRSSINTVEKLKHFLQEIKQNTNIELTAIMGYEAQIAGVGDNNENDFLKNKIVRFLKNKSWKEIEKRRNQFYETIQNEGFEIAIHNAGGSGSVHLNTLQTNVTEITVGSVLYNSHLFDYYIDFKHLPAMGFALQITRKPTVEIVTCNGGGYIGSGSANKNKLPKPYLPKGLQLIGNEGAGEVQTPLILNGNNLTIGDAVFFRFAKAGEPLERFNEIHLIDNGQIIDTVKTYRGEGFTFM